MAPKIPPKKVKKEKKIERPEGCLEATVNIRMNGTGAQVVFECANPDCGEQVGPMEEHDFENGKFTIEESEGVADCENCQAKNFNGGFTIAKI